jgi:competence transcription factor ComK
MYEGIGEEEKEREKEACLSSTLGRSGREGRKKGGREITGNVQSRPPIIVEITGRYIVFTKIHRME